MARVIIAEDEPIIAMMLEDWLNDLGHIVVGTATRNADAIDMVEHREADCAIIDFHLADGVALPLISEMNRCSKPFVVLTGASNSEIRAVCTRVPVLGKPIDFDELRHALNGLYVPPPPANAPIDVRDRV